MVNELKESVSPKRMETITLGGGCFWCLEAVFNEVKGVKKVESGYSGGLSSNPTYEQVSTGKTGHIEVVQITFDSEAISFKEILEIYFSTHDPTTLNRQGNDVGTQYRSVIFYNSIEQKEISDKAIEDLNSQHIWNSPIVTVVEPLNAFYRAEGYHDHYFEHHSYQPYCRLIIAPKLVKLREHLGQKFKL